MSCTHPIRVAIRSRLLGSTEGLVAAPSRRKETGKPIHTKSDLETHSSADRRRRFIMARWTDMAGCSIGPDYRLWSIEDDFMVCWLMYDAWLYTCICPCRCEYLYRISMAMSMPMSMRMSVPNLYAHVYAHVYANVFARVYIHVALRLDLHLCVWHFV